MTSREPRRAACARAHFLVRFPPCRGTRSRITSGLEIGGVQRPSDASFAGSPARFDPIRRQLTCLRFPVPLIRFLVPSAIARPPVPSRASSRALSLAILGAHSPRAGAWGSYLVYSATPGPRRCSLFIALSMHTGAYTSPPCTHPFYCVSIVMFIVLC